MLQDTATLLLLIFAIAFHMTQVVGGVSGGKVTRNVAVFNTTLNWAYTTESLIPPGKAWSASAALNHKLYIMGGGDNLGPFAPPFPPREPGCGAGVVNCVQVFTPTPGGGGANGTMAYAMPVMILQRTFVD